MLSYLLILPWDRKRERGQIPSLNLQWLCLGMIDSLSFGWNLKSLSSFWAEQCSPYCTRPSPKSRDWSREVGIAILSSEEIPARGFHTNSVSSNYSRECNLKSVRCGERGILKPFCPELWSVWEVIRPLRDTFESTLLKKTSEGDGTLAALFLLDTRIACSTGVMGKL